MSVESESSTWWACGGGRSRLRAWGLAVLAAMAMVGRPAPSEATITFTPSGFVEDVVASDLPFATGIAFAPDGRMFITLKGGVVRVYQNGALLPTPFLDITSQVSELERPGPPRRRDPPRLPAHALRLSALHLEPAGVLEHRGRRPRLAAHPRRGRSGAGLQRGAARERPAADGGRRPRARDHARHEQHRREHRQPDRRSRHHQGVVHDRPHDGRRTDRELHGVRRGLALHRHGHVRQRRLAVRRQRRRLELHGGRSARAALAEREQPGRQDHADRSADRQRPARQPLLRRDLPDV